MDPNRNLRLADIPGLGPKRRAALREVGIEDLQGLLAMKAAELAAVQGIGQWQAQRIREELRVRGLLVEVEAEDGSPVLVATPHTQQEADLVQAAVSELQHQADVEARMAAEVGLLEEALAGAVAESDPRFSADAPPPVLDRTEETEPPMHHSETPNSGTADPAREAADQIADSDAADAAPQEPDQEAASDAGPKQGESPRRKDGPDHGGRLQDRREQLPDTALTLIEAIRQAAVARTLTRQITRLLITTGEFASTQRSLTGEQKKAASDAVSATDRALRRAIERREFSLAAQKQLARQIRKRRRELEPHLEPD